MTHPVPNPRRTAAVRLAAAALLALAAWAPEATAQGDRCRAVVERLERVQTDIDRARDMLRDCRSPEARKFLDGAVESLRRARSEARGGECRRGEILGDAALRLAARAVDACREGDGQRDQLARFLDRTDALLREASDAGAGTGGECETLLRVAFEDQRKARDAFRGDRLRISLKLTLRAQELCDRVMACVEEGGLQGEIPVQHALLRTDHFLAETERLLRDHDGAEDALVALGHGRRLQEQAWRSFRGARFPLSLGLTRQARALANQALLELETDPEPGEVTRVLEGTGEFVSRLEAAAGPGPGEPQTLLRQAREQLDRGRAALDRGDPRAALVHARTASGLAMDAAGRLETPGER